VKRLIKALPLLALTAAASAAQPPARCAISAFVTDNDPAGTNIRSSPSTTAQTISHVPSGSDAVADIDGMAGGWFRVKNVEQVGDDPRTLFQGRGWMHRSVLGVDVAFENPRLYAAASERSRVVAKLRTGESRVTLIGCSGRWALVRSANRTGWLSPAGQCASPLTNCS